MNPDESPVPDYPPLEVRVVIPLDSGGEPYLDEPINVADYIVVSALKHLVARMERETQVEHDSEWEVGFTAEGDDDG